MSIMKVALLICFSFLINRTDAQTLFGFSAGSNIDYYHADISGRLLTTLKPGIGFNSAVHVLRNFHGRSSLQIGLLYSLRYHTVKRNGSLTGAYTKAKRNLIQMPVLFGLALINKKKVKVSIIAGSYISYWISGTIEGRIHNVLDFRTVTEGSDAVVNIELTSFKEAYQFNSQDKRFEYGLAIGMNVGYELSSKRKLFVSTQYHKEASFANGAGITSVMKDGNQGIIFLFGIMFSFEN